MHRAARGPRCGAPSNQSSPPLPLFPSPQDEGCPLTCPPTNDCVFSSFVPGKWSGETTPQSSPSLGAASPAKPAKPARVAQAEAQTPTGGPAMGQGRQGQQGQQGRQGRAGPGSAAGSLQSVGPGRWGEWRKELVAVTLTTVLISEGTTQLHGKAHCTYVVLSEGFRISQTSFEIVRRKRKVKKKREIILFDEFYQLLCDPWIQIIWLYGYYRNVGTALEKQICELLRGWQGGGTRVGCTRAVVVRCGASPPRSGAVPNPSCGVFS